MRRCLHVWWVSHCSNCFGDTDGLLSSARGSLWAMSPAAGAYPNYLNDEFNAQTDWPDGTAMWGSARGAPYRSPKVLFPFLSCSIDCSAALSGFVEIIGCGIQGSSIHVQLQASRLLGRLLRVWTDYLPLLPRRLRPEPTPRLRPPRRLSWSPPSAPRAASSFRASCTMHAYLRGRRGDCCTRQGDLYCT